MQTIVVTRVAYGSKDTPPSKREYSMTFGGAVGTKAEWMKWAKEHNVKMKFQEKLPDWLKELKKRKEL